MGALAEQAYGNMVDTMTETWFPLGMTNEPTDEVLDAVAAALTETPEPPNRIGRMARVSTTDAYTALCWLTTHRMAIAIGNGAWTKYRTRRFGEV